MILSLSDVIVTVLSVVSPGVNVMFAVCKPYFKVSPSDKVIATDSAGISTGITFINAISFSPFELVTVIVAVPFASAIVVTRPFASTVARELSDDSNVYVSSASPPVTVS